MMSVDECLTDDARILLVGMEDKKNFFRRKDTRIYRKSFNHAEFIGEELCGIRNLKCAHYFLIGEGFSNPHVVVRYEDIKKFYYPIKIGSYDFKDNVQYEYFRIEDSNTRTNGEYLDMILELCPNEENKRELLREICELFALDTYMGQIDRYSLNILFMRNKKTREIHLAPLYDFQYSLKSYYCCPEHVYDNSLHSFNSIDDYRIFIEHNPEFRDMLMSYLNVDLCDVIRRGYAIRGLKVPDDKFGFYREFQDGRVELIKKIVK